MVSFGFSYRRANLDVFPLTGGIRRSEMKTISWDKPMLARFETAYAEAVKHKVEVFTFEGNEFVPGYAKYLIEYLKGSLK